MDNLRQQADSLLMSNKRQTGIKSAYASGYFVFFNDTSRKQARQQQQVVMAIKLLNQQ